MNAVKKITMNDIVKFGYPALRVVSKDVVAFDKELVRIIEKMRKILYANNDGAALAAPQIAIEKRIVVIDYEDEYYELVNPRIISHSNEMICGYEGCLSLPHYWGEVLRFEKVTVEYYDRNGKKNIIEKTDAMARCLQHEIDHLDGILFIDRMKDDYVETSDKKERLNIEKFKMA